MIRMADDHRARELTAKHARLVADAADADHLADEFQQRDRPARLIAAQRARADRLLAIAREVQGEIAALKALQVPS